MKQGRRSVYYFWSCFASGKISQTAEVGRTLIFSSDWLLFSSYKCRVQLRPFRFVGLSCDWGQNCEIRGKRSPLRTSLSWTSLALLGCWVPDPRAREWHRSDLIPTSLLTFLSEKIRCEVTQPLSSVSPRSPRKTWGRIGPPLLAISRK